jgi:hypothetical protein
MEVTARLGALRSASEGGRAVELFKHAAALGGLVGAGVLDESEAEDLLLEAALHTGLDRSEASTHIRRGLRRGKENPRVLRARTESARRDSPPPRAEVESLWRSSRPVTENAGIAAWLASRGLDPSAVELWDLARALPSAGLPPWARTRQGNWIETGHRVVLRLWNAKGDVASLRARCVLPGSEGPKSLAPSGYAVRGLVLTDPLGAQILAGADLAWWKPEVVISEGEPDFLTWATRQPDAGEQGPAVFGVEAGGWTQSIADRIPDGARVAVRTHADGAGSGYADRISATLRGRCSVFRLGGGS